MEFRIPKDFINRKIVYVIRNNIDSRIYIGSTKEPLVRHKHHTRDLKNGNHSSKKLQNFYNKYGHDSLSMELLESVQEGVCRFDREQKYLDIYRPYKVGFNHSKLAYCPSVEWTSERRAKISKMFSGENNPFFGKKHSEELIIRQSLKSGRKIQKLSRDGVLVAEYDSPYLAAKEEGLNSVCLTDACRNQKTYKNHYWKYISEPIKHASFSGKKHSKESLTKISLAKGTKIVQKSINGEPVTEFANSREAAELTGFHQGNINSACRSNKKYHGFYWEYSEPPKNNGRVGDKCELKNKTCEKKSLIKMSRTKSGPVYQFDLNKNLIKEHPSIYEASVELGLTSRSISSVCLYSKKSEKGYVFRFKNGVRCKANVKKVLQKDTSANLIKKYENIYEGCELLEVASTGIYHACKYNIKYKEHFWSFENE